VIVSVSLVERRPGRWQFVTVGDYSLPHLIEVLDVNSPRLDLAVVSPDMGAGTDWQRESAGLVESVRLSADFIIAERRRKMAGRAEVPSDVA